MGVCLGTDSSRGSGSNRLTSIAGSVVEVGEGQEMAPMFNQAYEGICLPARAIAGCSQGDQELHIYLIWSSQQHYHHWIDEETGIYNPSSVRGEWSPIFCISNKVSAGADAADLELTGGQQKGERGLGLKVKKPESDCVAPVHAHITAPPHCLQGVPNSNVHWMWNLFSRNEWVWFL